RGVRTTQNSHTKVTKVRLAAQPTADRSVQWLRPCHRWTAPANRGDARRHAGTPSARQRARTAAAPCLHRFVPPGAQWSAPAPLRSARAPPSSLPYTPSRGLCGLSSLLASVCTVMPQGSCVKAWPRCTHQQDGHCLLTTSEGVWCARQAAVLADHGRRPFAWRGTANVYACRTRCGRGLAASAGAACP